MPPLAQGYYKGLFIHFSELSYVEKTSEKQKADYSLIKISIICCLIKNVGRGDVYCTKYTQ